MVTLPALPAVDLVISVPTFTPDAPLNESEPAPPDAEDVMLPEINCPPAVKLTLPPVTVAPPVVTLLIINEPVDAVRLTAPLEALPRVETLPEITFEPEAIIPAPATLDEPPLASEPTLNVPLMVRLIEPELLVPALVISRAIRFAPVAVIEPPATLDNPPEVSSPASTSPPDVKLIVPEDVLPELLISPTATRLPLPLPPNKLTAPPAEPVALMLPVIKTLPLPCTVKLLPPVTTELPLAVLRITTFAPALLLPIVTGAARVT